MKASPSESRPLVPGPQVFVIVGVRLAENVHAADDYLDDFGGRVGEVEHAVVVFVDVIRLEHRLFEPAEHAAPVVPAEEHDGEVPNLARLYQRERLEELVERAVAAGEDYEGVAVLDEHRLAHEEVLERYRARLVRVRLLLERQLDVTADGDAARVERAAVRGLHDAGAAARYHGEARLGERGGRLLRGRVEGVARGRARRA